MKEDGKVQSIGLHAMCQRKKSFDDQKIMEERAVEIAKKGKGGVKSLWKISDNSGYGKFFFQFWDRMAPVHLPTLALSARSGPARSDLTHLRFTTLQIGISGTSKHVPKFNKY